MRFENNIFQNYDHHISSRYLFHRLIHRIESTATGSQHSQVCDTLMIIRKHVNENVISISI